jgi:hypothetical protein
MRCQRCGFENLAEPSRWPEHFRLDPLLPTNYHPGIGGTLLQTSRPGGPSRCSARSAKSRMATQPGSALLSLVIDRAPAARLLVLLTCRPEFRPPWTTRSYCMQLTLSRLGPSQVEVMLARLTGGKVLPAEVYGWFTEGFDTADLQEAKAVLEELS